MKNKKKIALRIVAGILVLISFLAIYYALVLLIGFQRIPDNLPLPVRGNASEKVTENEIYTLIT